MYKWKQRVQTNLWAPEKRIKNTMDKKGHAYTSTNTVKLIKSIKIAT